MWPPACMLPHIFVGAGVLTRPPVMFLYRLGDISPCGASFFLSDQKETKESPGDVAFGKDLRLAPWSFMSHFPPDPRFYGGARGMRKQLRPARKPHERYLCLLTAVLLNELDRLLLQDAMRLSGAAYTVGGNRRPGEGTGPYRTGGKPYGRAATRGRPYGEAENRLADDRISDYSEVIRLGIREVYKKIK